VEAQYQARTAAFEGAFERPDCRVRTLVGASDDDVATPAKLQQLLVFPRRWAWATVARAPQTRCGSCRTRPPALGPADRVQTRRSPRLSPFRYGSKTNNNDKIIFYRYTEQVSMRELDPGAAAGRHAADVVLLRQGVRPLTNLSVRSTRTHRFWAAPRR
jgi:hypothetical protein